MLTLIDATSCSSAPYARIHNHNLYITNSLAHTYRVHSIALHCKATLFSTVYTILFICNVHEN